MCAKYKRGDGEFIIPIQLICSEQRLPVNFDLRVRVTSNKIVIDPRFIDFGIMYQDTAKKIDLDFENTSDLSQELYFYPLPKTITYEPAQIPISILPGEMFKISFVYRAYEIRKEEDYIVIVDYLESQNRDRRHCGEPNKAAVQGGSDQVPTQVQLAEGGLPHSADWRKKHALVHDQELLLEDLLVRVLPATLRNLWSEDFADGLQVTERQVG